MIDFPPAPRSSCQSSVTAHLGAHAPRRPLVLSLFPGVDLLGRAFQAAGFTVVRGPDLILDDPIESWSGTPGVDGIIGGPPCQNYSDANRRRDTAEGDRLLRHYLRVVDESRPTWFLIENVRNVPDVAVDGYAVQRLDITDVECGGPTRRLRHIQFGHVDGWVMRPPRTDARRPVTAPAVLTSPASPHDRHCRRCDKQGVPYLPLRALTRTARYRVLGNAVPYRTAWALALGVLGAGPVTPADCACGCGRPIAPPARCAGAACRKRLERARRGDVRRLVTIAPSLDVGSRPQGAAGTVTRGVTPIPGACKHPPSTPPASASL